MTHCYHWRTILDDCDEVTYVCPGRHKVSCSHWIVPGTYAPGTYAEGSR